MLPRHWSFAAPGRLLVLVVVAALALAYLLLQQRRSAYETRFSDVDLLASVMPRRAGWRRHLPAALLVLALTALTTGFARPSADLRVRRERATVVIALDTSASMDATDVRPSRLQAAKAAAERFVRGLPRSFDVGLVSFSGTAAVVVPPGQDRRALAAAIEDLPLGGGTAIGDAVSASVGAAKAVAAQGSKAPVRIVLLSDGTSTVGRSVQEGAQEAVQAQMPVTTIAYGTQGGSVVVQGQVVAVPVDRQALADLAATTGGQSYTALSGSELRQVYDSIAREAGTTTKRTELTAALTGLGLLLALAAAGASLVWFRVLP